MNPVLELCVETSLRERRIYLPDSGCEVYEHRLTVDSALLVIYFQRPGFCSSGLHDTGIALLPEARFIRYQFHARPQDGHVVIPLSMTGRPLEE